MYQQKSAVLLKMKQGKSNPNKVIRHRTFESPVYQIYDISRSNCLTANSSEEAQLHDQELKEQEM